jgi:hypothetical protein
MAIQNFKNILNNKAYFIKDEDRKIFEKGELSSFFGFSDADVIEFIVYDINNNQLPQADYGVVRYIPMTTENILEYILINEGTTLVQSQTPEYFVDVERLLNEAGYLNGIFKTQITLINRRVGSNGVDDKLWIKEISPSRREVRLLPLKTELSSIYDLDERFSVMISDGTFKGDIMLSLKSFIDNIHPTKISSWLISEYTSAFVDRLKSEYNINNIDEFSGKVYNTFLSKIFDEFSKRNGVGLSIDQTKKICSDTFRVILDDMLITTSINSTTTYTQAVSASIDNVTQTHTISGSTHYDTSDPVLKYSEIKKPTQSDAELSFDYKLNQLIQSE